MRVPLLLSAVVAASRAQSPLDEVQWQSGNARVDSLVNALTPEEKILLVHGFVASEDPGDQQQAAYVAPVARLGIPAMRLTDGEAGINVVNNATAIPVQLNVAATWSKKAAYDAGVVTGRESYLLGNGMSSRSPFETVSR